MFSNTRHVRAILRSAIVAGGLAVGPIAHGAEIAAPEHNSSGTFTVTWTPGYELRLADVQWQVAGPTTSSHTFTDLPSGLYQFSLASCAWTYSGLHGFHHSCSAMPGTATTVRVERDPVPALDLAAVEAGTMPYRADVSLRGSARINVPLRMPEALSGAAGELSLVYDSARPGDRPRYVADDLLGYGWSVEGLSVIHRCRVGLGDDTDTEAVLGSSDRICLDGEPLQLVGGVHDQDNAEYRTEVNRGIRIIRRGTADTEAWFEVFYPDGSVGRFGNSEDSRVRASGIVNFLSLGVTPAPTLQWGLRSVSAPEGNSMQIRYYRFDGYGSLQPRTIVADGAEVQFSYRARADLPPVFLGIGNHIRRHSVLTGIGVTVDGVRVREYRLESAADAQGRVRLESIQACGFDAVGVIPACQLPLRIDWVEVAATALNAPIVVAGLTDGMGAQTRFNYAALTDGRLPLGYSEAPFGLPGPVAGAAAADFVAVAELMRSDGLYPAGWQRWSFGYRGAPQRSTLSRGFNGFFEVRTIDRQSGITSYLQTRMDWPFIGTTSQLRSFDRPFGTHTRELVREEHGYQQKVHVNGARDIYRSRSHRWLIEGAAVVGAKVETVFHCYRTLSGDQCPGSGTEHEYVTQRRHVAVEGSGISNPAFTPAFWGDVPVRGISSQHLRRSVTTVAGVTNSGSPWVRDAVTRLRITHSIPGASDRTVDRDIRYRPGSRVIERHTRFPGDASRAVTLTRTFDSAAGNRLVAETLSGQDFTPRSYRYSGPGDTDRLLTQWTNPLGHRFERSMDPRFDLPAVLVDPNGRESRIDYDPFARPLRRLNFAGSELATAYERCDMIHCPSVGGLQPAMRISTHTRNGSVQTAPTRRIYLDVLGRTVLVEVEALDAQQGWHRQHVEYDNRGRPLHRSPPYFADDPLICGGNAGRCTTYRYDDRDRVVREERPDGSVTTTAFSGTAGRVTATVTESVVAPGSATATRVRRAVFDAIGQLTEVSDAHGTAVATTTAYGYDAHGNLSVVTVNGATVAAMEYDLAGNRTRIDESNSGTTQFVYNGLGELQRTVDAKGQTSSYTYDLLGRVTRRADSDGMTAVWHWDPADNLGALRARSRGSFTEVYSYDPAHGGLLRVQTTVQQSGVWQAELSRTLTYDAAGRLIQQRYPNGAAIGYRYASSGHLSEVHSGATILHRWRDTDAFGNSVMEEFHGGALRRSRGYDPATGQLLRVQSGTLATPRSIQNLEFTWRSNQSLQRRIDRGSTLMTSDALIDTFAYDGLDRLVAQGTTGASQRTQTFSYDRMGNLTARRSSAVGDLNVTGYQYPTAAQPQRLRRVTLAGVDTALNYDANGNIAEYRAAEGPDTFLQFDARNQVTRVTVGVSSSNFQARDEFWYDADGMRFLTRESWLEGGLLRARRTLRVGGDYEDTVPPSGSTYDRIQRIQVTDAVRLVRRRSAATGQWESLAEYLFRDHLGSIAVITDSHGAHQAEYSFDPFGTRRRPQRDGDLDSGGHATMLARVDQFGAQGFTGHEQRDRTGFIHMAGRLYDPRLGRFVSPDRLVQSPTFSQSFNRYAYVFNSPLSFTDPSGWCGTQGLGPLARCHTFDELVRVIGKREESSASMPGVSGADRQGASASGLEPARAAGGSSTWNTAALVAQLSSRLPAPTGVTGPALEHVEVIGQSPEGSGVAGWDSQRGIERWIPGVPDTLFGSACAGAILGGCGSVSWRTTDGALQVELLIGIVPGAGFALGTERVLLAAGPESAPFGVGTAVMATGGVGGFGAALTLAQGSDGVALSSMHGFGFGFGGGVGFYLSLPLGSMGQ